MTEVRVQTNQTLPARENTRQCSKRAETQCVGTVSEGEAVLAWAKIQGLQSDGGQSGSGAFAEPIPWCSRETMVTGYSYRSAIPALWISSRKASCFVDLEGSSLSVLLPAYLSSFHLCLGVHRGVTLLTGSGPSTPCLHLLRIFHDSLLCIILPVLHNT